MTDPKFGWVARKSGQTVASVVAVWAALLECGSTATQCNADATRGNVASFDCNDFDVLFGLDDGATQAIFSAMEAKGLIRDDFLVKWEERQPKREDSGNPKTGALSSTERSRLRREKLKREGTQGNDMQRDATQGNAPEEIRLDKSSKPKGSNDDGGDLIRGSAVDNSEASSSLSAKEIAELLRLWECERGKNPRFAPDAQQIVEWAMRGITAEQLRTAYDDAVAQRDHDRDMTAVNAGFLDPFVAKALAPPKPKPLRSMTDVELEAEGRRLGVSTHGLKLDQCIAKLEQARTQHKGRPTA
ncbi:hypothetical protein [Paraburkholderia sp. MM5477-R1]|uniref:hypothetical protein n=1 Tax=Paraburkholderia sp. MM5477-R1 TaxID=2991062 RepID=UPI003D19DC6B